jgi:hypothetical protein
VTLERFPMAIHQRLGNAGAAALSDVFEAYKDDVVTLVTHQFEQRLNRECGALRAEMAEMQGALRGAISELRGELRGEITAFRSEMRTEVKELRMEMRSDFKIELASARTDLLKWSFVFWVGQMVGVVGVITALR